MAFIENLRSTTLSDFLIVAAVLAFIIFWAYFEVKGSILGVSFQIVRNIFILLIATVALVIFSRDKSFGVTMNDVYLVVAIGITGILYLLVENKDKVFGIPVKIIKAALIAISVILMYMVYSKI